MASNHVPSDQVPLQGQNIYTNPSYQNLFSSVDRYGTPAWDSQLTQHSGVASNDTSNQAWHHGSFPQQSYNAFSQPYGAQHHGIQTASPYQYGQFGQQGAMTSYAQPSNVDPSLGLEQNALRQQQQSPYQMPMRNSTPQGHAGTITPQALQNTQLQNTRPSASPYQTPRTNSELFAQRAMSSSTLKPVPIPTFEIPKGKKSGGFYVLDQSALAKATKSTALNKLVTLGSESFHLATNRTALPLYTARQSVKELKKVGADNKKLLAKLSSSKPSVAKALKTRAYASSPSSLKREVSDSEDYTDSSDDSSEYTDDEEDEPSPLPASRPEEPHAAVRYDIIKATWYPRRTPLSSEKIKESMRDIWEVLNTIQKRWRADSKAVSDAEAEKKTGELPVLKSRVASQRDLLQSALKAALEHTHPDVLYHLGQIKPFMYLCYQFLANRFHSKDFDGELPAAVFEILARCGTLTSELLEETKVIKALTSMKKHANDAHKALIQKIVDGAIANTKKAKASSPPQAESTDAKGVKRLASEPATRSSDGGPAAKKPKPAEGPANLAKTTTATSTTTRAPATPLADMMKKKPAAAPAPVKARVNQVANKPSGIFASLNAASKKPTPAAATAASKTTVQSKSSAVASKDKKPAVAPTKPAFSFAQTMASLLKPKEPEATPVKAEKQLPPETPEEKAKRLRKEARRHLRVTFRPDTALVQIKYFSHDPEEELGHEDNFVQDAGDIEGEGRMFKQHREHDIDDDDEDEADDELKPWKDPTLVDFSSIATATQGNYAPYGGGQQVATCPEKEANTRRENATLMVFYADPKDIPSSPREPLEQEQEAAPAVTVTQFGTPEEKVLSRCPQGASAPLMDLKSLEAIFAQFGNAGASQVSAAPLPAPVSQTVYPPAPAMPSGTHDLQSILSSLQAPAAMQPQPPAPLPMQIPPPPGPLPPNMDIGALSAFLAAQGGGLPPPPPGPPPFPFAFPIPPQQQDATMYQTQQQSQYPQANGGNKRQREDNNNDRGQGKKHKNRGERPHKVLPCKFFQKGTCNKGDNCTYVHDLNM
ncbi:hypothetical protein EK21DRAFT_51820 [Setomelanomma holmii]|uniref:C3H1-type domain-containing protein n=1 Tax=Setomelanomma holmii TaxID=210430 RepID=A0A9P4HMZ6_9PLEO|nr:hypothetical protein EK21DRAFT_51820 [Setomelanomma holmii]